MAKLYSKNSLKKVNPRIPKEETVKFLLNYSKALRITRHKSLQFEAFLN